MHGAGMSLSGESSRVEKTATVALTHALSSDLCYRLHWLDCDGALP